MVDKKLYRGAVFQRWIVIVYERQQRFSQSAADNMIDGLRKSASDMGMVLAVFLNIVANSCD